MKPTAPSDNDASGATWPAVLQHGAEVLQQGARRRLNSCIVGSHPVTFFPHAGCFKNKKSQPLTASSLLSPVLLRSAVVASALVASCKPGPCSWATNPQHTKGTTWHCPSRCPQPTDMLLHVGLQRCPHTTVVWHYRLSSTSLAGGKLNQAGSLGDILRV